MSHAIRGLEEGSAFGCFRGPPSVTASQQLLAQVRSALTDVQDALDQPSGLRDKPVDRVRL